MRRRLNHRHQVQSKRPDRMTISWRPLPHMTAFIKLACRVDAGNFTSSSSKPSSLIQISITLCAEERRDSCDVLIDLTLSAEERIQLRWPKWPYLVPRERKTRLRCRKMDAKWGWSAWPKAEALVSCQNTPPWSPRRCYSFCCCCCSYHVKTRQRLIQVKDSFHQLKDLQRWKK